MSKDYTYNLYLVTPNGNEELLCGEKDPQRIHTIINGKSFRKRLKKFGHSALITRDNKKIQLGDLERICLDIWLEKSESLGLQD